MIDAFQLNEKTGLYKSKRAMSSEDIIQQALVILNELLRQPEHALTSPSDTRDFLSLKLAKLEHEVFACIFLDNRHRVIAYEQLFRGTIDGASIHPREVVKTALKHNAAAVIFAHNHPSGVAEPSQSDLAITRRLNDALALVDIRVLDHFIVGSKEVLSFAERGVI